MKITRYELLLLVTITAGAFYATDARAQGLLIPVDAKAQMAVDSIAPEMPPGHRRPVVIRPPRPNDLPFRVTKSRVDVRIEENVAVTTLTQHFLNLSNRPLEVRVMIPLPKGATINRSALSMGDDMVQGKLYNAEEAHSIYTRIVASRRDPALLRFAGENLYEARVFPIAPNEIRQLQFSYDQVLEPIGGLYDFRHILAGSQVYRHGVEEFEFECVIRSKAGLGPVYSPSHTVSVKRTDTNTAVVKFREDVLATDRDFRLYYAPTTDDVALRVLAHRPSPNEDGYFMLIARPDDALEIDRILPKEVVFVLDTSGSMNTDRKIDQARNALSYCLKQLNPRDRFNLVTFSTEVKALSDSKMLDATPDNIKQALAVVETLEATGGTDIDGALRAALSNDFSSSSAATRLVLFLTDGRPSVGITDSRSILKDVDQFNRKAGARVFVFGVGTDVNTHLLDKMALDCEGASAYVAPKEDIELKVSDFYNKVRHPVMTDLAVDFGQNVRAHSPYPKKLPALFKGNEIILMGRYKGTGASTVTLSGNVAGEKKTITLNVHWPDHERDHDFLPRVWAMRKIGHLLETIRLHGSNQELIEEVVALAQQHGIVTPYTSQLVLEPNMQVPPGRNWRGNREELRQAMRDRADRPQTTTRNLKKAAEVEAGALAQQAAQNNSGDVAVALAEFEKKFKDAKSEVSAAPVTASAKPKAPLAGENKRRKESDDAAKSLHDRAFAGFDKGQGGTAGKNNDRRAEWLALAAEITIKHELDRAFYLRGGIWTDSRYDDAKHGEAEQVETYGERYFELLKQHPELSKVLALGEKILVVVGGKAYQVAPK